MLSIKPSIFDIIHKKTALYFISFDVWVEIPSIVKINNLPYNSKQLSSLNAHIFIFPPFRVQR